MSLVTRKWADSVQAKPLIRALAELLATMLLSQSSLSQEQKPTVPKRFEPVVGHQSSLSRDLGAQREPDQQRMPARSVLIDHLQALELAFRVYSEASRPETFIFGDDLTRQNFDRLKPHAEDLAREPTSLRNQYVASQFEFFEWQPVYHWKVLDIADRTNVRGSCSEPSEGRTPDTDREAWRGFRAVTYVNHRARRVVVAVAGTDVFSADDWKNDLVALGGYTAPYFEVACAYMRHIIETYKARLKDYEFECAGHSLGGGACSHAASRLGLRGVTLNPIGTVKSLRVKPFRTGVSSNTGARPGIFNYVDPEDPAHFAYKAADRVPSGLIYWIAPHPNENAGGMLDGVLQFLKPKKSAIERAWATYQAHRATISLDRLVEFEKLARIR